MPGIQQQISRNKSVYQTVNSTECEACGILKSSANSVTPGLAKVSNSHLTGISEIGVQVPVPFKSRHQTAPTESDISVGPLLTGITMMVLMRRHRY